MWQWKVRSWRQLVTWHPQSRSREQWLPVLSSLSPSLGSSIPGQGLMPSIVSVGLPTSRSLIRIILHGHGRRPNNPSSVLSVSPSPNSAKATIKRPIFLPTIKSRGKVKPASIMAILKFIGGDSIYLSSLFLVWYWNSGKERHLLSSCLSTQPQYTASNC